MRLSHILYPNEILSPKLPADIEIGKAVSDSRKLKPKDVFFCEDGFHESGFSYIENAIQAGASAIVTQRGGSYRIGKLPIPVIEVRDVRKSYALAWSRTEDHPEQALRLLAVTGTNGKTSVSSFLRELFELAGVRTGLVGTLAYSDGEYSYPSDYTTPPPDVLYPLFSKMKQAQTPVAVMEASSHAIGQNRLYGLSFETAIFTSLSRDHLDYHKTFEAYRNTKASLFKHTKNALINLDDTSAKHIAFEAVGDVYYYGTKKDADFYISEPVCDAKGIRYTLCFDSKRLPVEIPLIGNFHIYNTAAAIACAYLSGISAETLADTIKNLHAPTGRLEKLATDTDFSVYIDYAHSPDALAKALLSLRPFTKKLVVLFGAGGERDKGKRPEMGAVAERFADLAIVTSDNPRSENPMDIIRDIETGMTGKNHIVIEDRRDAIAYALETAEAGEILLLAGKGHETYTQTEKGKKAFCEREIVQRILNEKRKGTNHVSQLE